MLLTIDELRAYVTSALSDDALQALLDAAERDIGSFDQVVTERHEGGLPALVLSRLPGTFASVKEDADEAVPLTLGTTDYRVDGYILYRLDTGSNPSTYWIGEVEVKYTPTSDDEPERKRAQLALVRLDLAIASGVTSESIGDYSVSYGSNSRGSVYAEQRAAILGPFRPVMAR
jgi:hypothetical protein